MTDKNELPLAGDDGQGPEPSETQNLEALPQWARDAISKANREAASYRTKNKDAQEKLKAQEEAQRKADEARQAEAGEYRPLYEKTKAEADGLREKAKRAEEIETTFTGMLQKRLDAIPEQLRKRVPEFADPLQTMAWLDANADLFSQRTAPNLDPGAAGDTGKGGSTKLTATELMMAKKMGMKPDQYAKRKAEDAGQRYVSTEELEMKEK